jgi:acetyl-CoA carboxylase biotin carboxyl carrier protein
VLCIAPGAATRLVMSSPQRGERHVAEQVSAEMVANVHSIAVSKGDRVEAGTALLVLESMKMEIPVLAEFGGVVADVKVAAGDVVQEGDVLVVLE